MGIVAAGLFLRLCRLDAESVPHCCLEGGRSPLHYLLARHFTGVATALRAALLLAVS